MAIHPDSAAGIDTGTVVGDTYEVTRLIGRGGMGAVWEANHLRLPGKRVAIKVLHADIASDAESLARFRREAEVASKLGHPNIVQVIDFNTLPDGAPYLVLEYLQGESLDQRLARGALGLSEVFTLLRQIGSGLSAAHRENVVHRDLKPQNIFLCPTEMGGDITIQVKVLDFGISKIRGSQTIKTQESTILGTPQYMAPEQATGAHKDVDNRTDVFALGAIVYEMLAGKPAFGGQSVPEVVFKVVYEKPTPLAELVPGLPGDVVAAVERALEKKQDDRFAGINEFVEALTGRPLVTLRGHTPAPVPATPSAGAATAETQAASSDALAETMHSGNHPAPDLPMPSAADVVSGDTDKRRARETGEAALAQTIATTGKGTSVAAATADLEPSRSRKGLFAILAAVVLIAGAAVAFVATRGGDGDGESAQRGRTSARAEPPGDPEVAPDRDPAVAADPSADESEGTPAEDQQAAPPAEDQQVAPPAEDQQVAPPAEDQQKAPPAEDQQKATPPKHTEPKQRQEPDEPDESDEPPTGTLAEARDALRAGNDAEAIRLAKQALRTGGRRGRDRAAAIITVAYCRKQDLGNARAWLRKLPRRTRRRVKAQCGEAGVDL